MPYDHLETQKLFREYENGQWRMLPGAALIERFYNQMKEADAEVRLLSGEVQDLQRPSVPRRRREATPKPAPAPPPLSPQPLSGPAGPVTRLPTPAPGIPALARGAGGSPYLGGAREEAPPPIPFQETADPADAPAAPTPPQEEPKKRRARGHRLQ